MSNHSRIHKNLLSLFIFFFISISVLAQEKGELLIVTFGNSTTAPRKGIDKVYAVRIAEILTDKGIKNKVINSGVGGSHTGSVKDNNYAKIEHAMDRFDKSVLAHHPNWVTMNFGLNDSWQDKGESGLSRISLDQYRANLSFFIDQVKHQQGKIILLTPNPIGKKFESWRYGRVKEYKKITKRLTKEKKIYFIDSWKLFYRYVRKDPKGIDVLLSDGIHPNDGGHKLIAEAIAKIIIRSEK